MDKNDLTKDTVEEYDPMPHDPDSKEAIQRNEPLKKGAMPYKHNVVRVEPPRITEAADRFSACIARLSRKTVSSSDLTRSRRDSTTQNVFVSFTSTKAFVRVILHYHIKVQHEQVFIYLHTNKTTQ